MRVYKDDGAVHTTQLLFVTHNSLKKINAPLLAGRYKYYLTKQGAVTLTAVDNSKITYNLYGGNFPENDLISDNEIVKIFGNSVIDVHSIDSAIIRLKNTSEQEIDKISNEQFKELTKILEKLTALKEAFLI
jgi:hypothetical protein